MASQNLNELRNAELRSKRDAYGLIVVAAGDTNAQLDRAHRMRVANDEIRDRKGTQ